MYVQMQAIAGHERLKPVQVPMLPDHHFRTVPLTLQHGRQAEVIVGVPCLHRGGALPRKGAAERGEQSPGGLYAVRKKVLKIDAVLFQSIEKGGAFHLAVGLLQIPAIQPFEKHQEDVGRRR